VRYYKIFLKQDRTIQDRTIFTMANWLLVCVCCQIVPFSITQISRSRH